MTKADVAALGVYDRGELPAEKLVRRFRYVYRRDRTLNPRLYIQIPIELPLNPDVEICGSC